MVVASKTLNYGLNKNKTLADLMTADKNRITLHDSTKPLTNLVIFVNRARGGEE